MGGKPLVTMMEDDDGVRVQRVKGVDRAVDLGSATLGGGVSGGVGNGGVQCIFSV